MITGDFKEFREGTLERVRRFLAEMSQNGKSRPPVLRALFRSGTEKLFIFAFALRDGGLRGIAGFMRMGAEKVARPAQGFFQRVPQNAYEHPDGLVDLGGDLNPARLIGAYAQGVYPWSHVSPLKWWSPAKRAVLHFEEMRIEKNLRRVLRQGRFRITFDTEFEGVMRGCARPRAGRLPITWISEKTIRAYRRLFALGQAHSVEAWDGEGRLVGGLYGVVHGGVFVIESQFAETRDASKAAFVTLARHLQEWGFVIADGKVMTGHLANMGMREISRSAYLDILHGNSGHKGPALWIADPALDIAGWQPAETAPAARAAA